MIIVNETVVWITARSAWSIPSFLHMSSTSQICFW